MKRGILQLLLALCFFGGLLIGRKEVSATKVLNDFHYNILENGTVEITDYSGNDIELEIPSEIDGKKVSRIGEYAFSECEKLRNLTIPDSVISIGKFSFYRCKCLEWIAIPEGVESIEKETFADCESLREIMIPVSVKVIKGCALADCSSLRGIYYAGSKEQWADIIVYKTTGRYYEGNNKIMNRAFIFYNMNGQNQGNSKSKIQKIEYKLEGQDENRAITLDTVIGIQPKEFRLIACSSEPGRKLSFKSSNKKVLTVNDEGKICVKKPGKASVTIEAESGDGYKAAVKVIRFFALGTLETGFIEAGGGKGDKTAVSWDPVQGASGYQYSISSDHKFKKDIRGDLGKKTRITLSGMQRGAEIGDYFYLRVRPYVKAGKKIYYGSWCYPEKLRWSYSS